MRYKSSLIIIISVFVSISCVRIETKQSIDLSTSIVTGKVVNQEYYSHIKRIDLTIPDFPGNIIVHSCPINEDGTFKMEIQPLVPRDISMYPLINHIFIKPGDSIYLELDFSNIRNVNFSGDGKIINNNINKYIKTSFVSFNDEAFELTPEDYRNYCDSVKCLNIAKRDEFSNKFETSESFHVWTQKCIETNYYLKLVEYPLNHSVREGLDWVFPNEYYSFISILDNIFESYPIYSGSFILADSFLKYYYGPKNFKEYFNSRFDIDSLMIEKLSHEYSYEILNQYLLSTFFHNYFNMNTLHVYDKYKDVYNKNITDPLLKKSLENHKENTKDYLENPHKISNSILYGNEFESQEPYQISNDRNILDSIIHKNKGRAVYAYFWATWCPPCIIDAPKFNDLMKEYSDKNIEFVFVCINNNPKRDSIIAAIYDGGTHYLCSPSEGKTLGKKFNFFDGIPYSLLINNEGDIVDYGRHIKPDNKYTLEKLEQLVNKNENTRQ